MKKKIWISITVVSILTIFIGANVFKAMSKEELTVKTVSIEEREITGNVMVPGTLELANQEFVYHEPEKGTIAELLVEKGDSIKEGTPLIRYENEQMVLEKEQNALSIESSYLRINQVKNQLADMEDKEDDLEEQVGKKEAAKTIDAERDQLKVEQKMADIELRQLLLQKETIEKQLANLEVKSETAGTVLAVNEEAATNINQAGSPLLHIGNVDQLLVEAVISEYDSLKVKEAQTVVLRSDVVPDKEWKGKITMVGLLPQQDQAAMGVEDTAIEYPIEVAIDGKGIEAKPGFKLIMEIERDKRTVPTIPVGAVKQDGEEYFVFTVEDGKASRKVVKVGVTSDELMEVNEGLKKEDTVITNPTNDLQDGTEVTVK
ncbi:efflux RND transporter periplasmic adaptor subunit [Metabacillus herbersteinensis]|uniref:Efflux RND transporter periplasmic adaptor subunit n=1 Tax=Metabacillus herbersteinensis TaxID=283816 RepID=A0ABV6GCT4_9BACI